MSVLYERRLSEMVHVFFTSIAIPSFLMGLGSDECEGLITVWAASLRLLFKHAIHARFQREGFSNLFVTLPSQLISSYLFSNSSLSADGQGGTWFAILQRAD